MPSTPLPMARLLAASSLLALGSVQAGNGSASGPALEVAAPGRAVPDITAGQTVPEPYALVLVIAALGALALARGKPPVQG